MIDGKHHFIFNLMSLHSIAFSGGYRALIIALVAFIHQDEFLNHFSDLYLVLMFCTSMIGFPAAAVLLQGNASIKLISIFYIAAGFSVVFSIFIYLFYGYEKYECLIFFLTLWLSSTFEFLRQKLHNSKSLRFIFLTSFISCGLAFIVIFSKVFAPALTLFILFFIPTSIMFLCVKFDVNKQKFDSEKFISTFKKFFQHSISASSSTSVNYLIPLVLVFYLGYDSSADLAIISTLMGLVLFVPRYVSNNLIYALRAGVASHHDFDISKKRIFQFVVFLSLVVVLVYPFVFDKNLYSYVFYSISLLTSQLSLPYSNLFSVAGRADKLMLINLVSLFLAIISSSALLVMNLFNEYYLLLIYFLYQFLKLFLSLAARNSVMDNLS